jgi:ClpP class serine protease
MSNSHKVKRFVAEKVNNTPLLVTEPVLRNIADYLENRTESYNPELGLVNDDSQRKEMIMGEDVAIIPIQGSLTYEKTFLGALCGMSSYQELLEMVEESIDMGAKTIVLDVDSGGGQAYAMLSTANAIRNRVDAAGANLIAYVDGMSASAAYGLSSIADEVIMHPDAQVGSVGVVIRLTNDAEAQKKEGVKTTYITSAKSKVPIDEEGGFKSEFLTGLQTEVDELHTKFATHVATHRGITLGQVNDTEAKVFNSDKALNIGFADKVMDHDEFYNYLADLQEGGKDMPLKIFKRAEAKAEADKQVVESAINNQEVKDDMKLEELQAELEGVSKQLEISQEETLAALEENEKLQAALSASQEELSSLQASNKEKELDARKAQLADVLAEDQVESVFGAVKELPQEAFEAVVAGYSQSVKAVEASEMFTEVGVDFEAKDSSEGKSQSVMNLIKQRKNK